MSWGQNVVFTKTITSGTGTFTSQINLTRAFSSVYLEVPTFSTNTEVYINAASTDGGTFNRVYHAVINSSTASCHVFVIQTGVVGFVPIPNGFKYLKVEVGSVVDDGASFNVVCSDS
jgi:hypothetical protein